MTAVLVVLVVASLSGLAAALAQLLFLPRARHGSLAESWPYPPGAPRRSPYYNIGPEADAFAHDAGIRGNSAAMTIHKESF